jgi:hypothetical protein
MAKSEIICFHERKNFVGIGLRSQNFEISKENFSRTLVCGFSKEKSEKNLLNSFPPQETIL